MPLLLSCFNAYIEHLISLCDASLATGTTQVIVLSGLHLELLTDNQTMKMHHLISALLLSSQGIQKKSAK